VGINAFNCNAVIAGTAPVDVIVNAGIAALALNPSFIKFKNEF
jgi:hypothetical protein